MAKILLIETATKTCSVGFCDGPELIGVKEETTENYTHSEVLHVYIDQLLKEHGVALSEFDAVCVSRGPGSYTGLRIGVASAKGFCFGAELKLLSVTSLLSVAHVAKERFEGYDYYIPMIDARRMEVYTQVFDHNLKPSSEVEAKVLDEESYHEFLQKGRCLFFGDGAEKSKQLLSHQNAIFEEVLPGVRGMVQAANEQFDAGQFEDVAYFEPYYLKDFVAGKKS